MGQLAYLRRRNTGRRRCHLWRKGRGQFGQRGQPIGESRQSTRVSQPVGKDGVQQGQQQQRVCARANEKMGVGENGRFRAARVHHHQLAAARLHLLQPPVNAGGGHQAAVGSQRIRAHHQEKVGAVHIGNGDEQLVAEHVVGGNVMRQLVHRGGREAASGAQSADEGRRIEHGTQIVNIRIALIDADGVTAVRRLHGLQPRHHLVKRLIPGDGFPANGRAPHRLPQPVGVLVNVLQGHRLRANVPPAKRIVGVAFDGHDMIPGHFDH